MQAIVDEYAKLAENQINEEIAQKIWEAVENNKHKIIEEAKARFKIYATGMVVQALDSQGLRVELTIKQANQSNSQTPEKT